MQHCLRASCHIFSVHLLPCGAFAPFTLRSTCLGSLHTFTWLSAETMEPTSCCAVEWSAMTWFVVRARSCAFCQACRDTPAPGSSRPMILLCRAAQSSVKHKLSASAIRTSVPSRFHIYMLQCLLTGHVQGSEGRMPKLRALGENPNTVHLQGTQLLPSGL